MQRGESVDYEKILKSAELKIDALDVGTEFFLKDLFDGTEWKKLKKGEKLSLGRRFKNCVELGKFSNVVYVGKAPNNSAIYKRV